MKTYKYFNEWNNSTKEYKLYIQHKTEMYRKCEEYIKRRYLKYWRKHFDSLQKSGELKKKRDLELLSYVMNKWHTIAKYRSRLQYFGVYH